MNEASTLQGTLTGAEKSTGTPELGRGFSRQVSSLWSLLSFPSEEPVAVELIASAGFLRGRKDVSRLRVLPPKGVSHLQIATL